jgi:hypothetical protein
VNACAGRLVSSPWWVTIVTMSSIVQATAAQQLSHSLFEMPVGVSDLGWTKFELFCGDIHESVSKTTPYWYRSQTQSSNPKRSVPDERRTLGSAYRLSFPYKISQDRRDVCFQNQCHPSSCHHGPSFCKANPPCAVN